MKSNTLIIAGLALLALLFVSSQAGATPAPSNVDLNNLAANFSIDPDQENRINTLYTAISNYNLTFMQVNFMLAQLLFESGLLTSQANYNLMNQNNYAGLTVSGGGYAAYPDIPTFISAYIGFLTKGSNPLAATSLTDFNNRLQQNGYYTEDPTVYYNGLNQYYTLLST